MSLRKILGLIPVLAISTQAFAFPRFGRAFDRAIFVIFENQNYADVIKQPFFKSLADHGANFTNFLALTHPSQANYIALTSGSTNGVRGDGPVDLNVLNVVDLLERKGLSWKVYVEAYPGNCYTGSGTGNYARKHLPFISYLNIQKNAARCAHLVNATEFDKDVTAGTLPNYVFYVPDLKNDGHDTGVAYADQWYSHTFSKYLNDPRVMDNAILISTFDESGPSPRNQIYTSIVGPAVKPGVYADQLNLLSLMRFLEENWNMGNLGKDDVTAPQIPNIWR